MPRRRDPQREQFWRELLAAQPASGQSIRAYCAARRVSVPSFYAWRRTLAGQCRPAVPAFVPVRVMPGAAVEVVLPAGVVVRVPAGADAAAVARLVAALGAAPC